MATILTSTPFANGASLVASTWNNKYDLLYNELNGNLNNANVISTAGVLESKILFADSGHDHSGSKAINIAASINTSGHNRGTIPYFDGTVWTTLGTGTEGQQLKYNFDSYSKLVIHFNGANGATSYTAETGQTVTFAGGAQLSTTQQKFGISSLAIGGTSDYVTVPDSADWAFGTGDFTIDFWVRFSDVSQKQAFVGQYQDVNNRIDFYWHEIDKVIYFFAVDAAANIAIYQTATWNPAIDTWYHIALVRNGANMYCFINGMAQIFNATVAIGTSSMPNIGASLEIAAIRNHTILAKGWMDEVRISKGIARWTSDFTPPNVEYVQQIQWA